MTARLIFISSLLLFVLAIAPNLHAQKNSASATMQVQVQVVEGSSITQTNSTNIVLADTKPQSNISELTTITMNNTSTNAFAISRPNTLALTDMESGASLEIPVIYFDSMQGKNLVSKAALKALGSAKDTRGKFEGSFTTSIAYL